MSRKRPKDEIEFSAEIRTAALNLDVAKEYAEQGMNEEAHASLDNCDRHLVHLEVKTQAQIAKRDER